MNSALLNTITRYVKLKASSNHVADFQESRHEHKHENVPKVQSEVTYPNFSYPNTSVIQMALAKPHPLFLATFVDRKLVVTVQMVDIECFRVRSTCCIAAEDTG